MKIRKIKLKIVLSSNGEALPLSTQGRAELKKKRLVSRVLTIAAVLFVMTLLVKAFFGDRGFLSVLKIRAQYASLYEEVRQLEDRDAALLKEVERLKSDDYYKEKLAREKLGFIKEGEVVFLFPSAHDEEKTGSIPLEKKDSEDNKPDR